MKRTVRKVFFKKKLLRMVRYGARRLAAPASQTSLHIWASVILLCGFSLIMICSASAYTCQTSSDYGNDPFYFTKRQGMFMLLGFAVMFVGRVLDYRMLFCIKWIIYLGGILCIGLLRSPLGLSENGATRWLNLGFSTLQVAEVVKVSVIIMLAFLVRYFYQKLGTVQLTFVLWIAGGLPAALLLLISNDLSSAIVVLGITYLVSLVCTKTWRLHLAALAAVFAFAGLYVLSIAWNMPDPAEITSLNFRTQRIAAWLDPERYPKGPGYQVRQALYAIGSGGLFGKGLGNSMQKLEAIPEAQNDMIFSVICEEMGVIGGLMVVGLLGALLWGIRRTAEEANEIFGGAICTAVFSHIAVQSIINLCVNVNFFPNTGLPLPFFSYGGTSVFFIQAEIALVLSVEQRRTDLEHRKNASENKKLNRRRSSSKGIMREKKSREGTYGKLL